MAAAQAFSTKPLRTEPGDRFAGPSTSQLHGGGLPNQPPAAWNQRPVVASTIVVEVRTRAKYSTLQPLAWI